MVVQGLVREEANTHSRSSEEWDGLLWAKVVRTGFGMEAGTSPMEGQKENWSYSQPSIPPTLNTLSYSWEAVGWRVDVCRCKPVMLGKDLCMSTQLKALRWVSEGKMSSLWKVHRCQELSITPKAVWKGSYPSRLPVELCHCKCLTLINKTSFYYFHVM